ncbi:MAG: glycosyltransferase family 4 protein [Deltaproteobacteria bacterium]|nr:glycosyltransferase family 4 protein [Deltaproteobacteria bacterium]
MNRKQLRILFCHWRGWPFGGGEIYLFKLMRALREQGHRISFLTQKDALNEKIGGISWHEIAPAPGWRNAKAQWRAICSVLGQETPDVLHLHETNAFLGPYVVHQLCRRTPSVLTLHFAGALCLNGTRYLNDGGICRHPVGPRCIRCLSIHPGRARKMLLQWLWVNRLKNVRCVTVGSGWLKSFCMRNGFPPEKLFDLAPYWHEPERGMARPEKSRDMLFVGRLRDNKGALHLLYALARLKDLEWRLLIVGEGEQKDRICDYIRERGLQDRISLVGTVPNETIWSYYARGAFLVFPSLFPETFGIAGTEAMSAGLPVIAYDAGGISDWLVHGRNGLMVHRGDVQGLSQAIRQLLENPGLRQSMGRTAHEDMSSRYSRSSHIRQLYNIYEKALVR